MHFIKPMTSESKTIDMISLEYQNRFMSISDRSVILTHEDPLERLEQLCEQGIYSYGFHHDEFRNGVMCSLKLKIGKGGQTIIKEARFIKMLSTDDSEGETLLVRAKKTVAAILLDKLDLGVVESDKQSEEETLAEEDVEIKFQEMASKGLNVMFEALNKVMSSDMMKGHTDE